MNGFCTFANNNAFKSFTGSKFPLDKKIWLVIIKIVSANIGLAVTLFERVLKEGQVDFHDNIG